MEKQMMTVREKMFSFLNEFDSDQLEQLELFRYMNRVMGEFFDLPVSLEEEVTSSERTPDVLKQITMKNVKGGESCSDKFVFSSVVHCPMNAVKKNKKSNDFWSQQVHLLVSDHQLAFLVSKDRKVRTNYLMSFADGTIKIEHSHSVNGAQDQLAITQVLSTYRVDERSNLCEVQRHEEERYAVSQEDAGYLIRSFDAIRSCDLGQNLVMYNVTESEHGERSIINYNSVVSINDSTSTVSFLPSQKQLAQSMIFDTISCVRDNGESKSQPYQKCI